MVPPTVPPVRARGLFIYSIDDSLLNWTFHPENLKLYSSSVLFLRETF